MTSHYGRLVAMACLSMIFALSFLTDVVDDPHELSTHLLDESTFTASVKQDNQERVAVIRKEIEAMGAQLKTQMQDLRDAQADTRAIKAKAGLWWFASPDARMAVQKSVVRENDLRRVVHNTADDVQLKWKEMKPLFGLQSAMFVADLLTGLASLVYRIFSTLVPPLSVSLFSLLVLGPISFFVVYLWLVVGWLLLPLSSAVLGLVWLLEIPFIIVEYAPSLTEFVAVYAGAVLFVWGCVKTLTWLTDPFVSINADLDVGHVMNGRRVKVD